MRPIDWLNRARFSKGHPFTDRNAQSDRESNLRNYFVEPEHYNRVLDLPGSPTSHVIYARRGAGKSALCRMFAEHCRKIMPGRILVALLTDWRPIIHARQLEDFAAAVPHRAAIILAVLRAMLQEEPSISAASGACISWFAWFYEQFGSQLKHAEQQRLRALLDSLEPTPLAPDDRPNDDIEAYLSALSQMLLGLGYTACYVLIDGVDDGLDQSPQWFNETADLLSPLVRKVRIHEIDGLALKYFIASEAVAVLQQRGMLHERLEMISISWDEPRLGEMLELRLSHFSDDHIRGLKDLATRELRETADIDSYLVQAAEGTPRQLLQLGNELFSHCMARATKDLWQIDIDSFKAIQASISKVRGKDQASAQRATATAPLEPGEAQDLVNLVLLWIVSEPDPSSSINRLTLNLASSVREQLPAPSNPRDQLQGIVRIVNSFHWHVSTSLHPLMELLRQILNTYGAYDIEKIRVFEEHAWQRLIAYSPLTHTE